MNPNGDHPDPIPTALRNDELGPIETRPLAALGHYHARWVWPPSFRGSWEWEALRDDIRTHGLRTPLTILADGRVLDGDHRFTVAQELGLDAVRVRVAKLPLPLSDEDQLRAEAFALQQATNRRQLNRHQMTALLFDLERAHGEEDRAATGLANLRRGPVPGQPRRIGPAAATLARMTGLSPRYIHEITAIAHRAARETQDQVRRGELSVGAAYATLAPVLPPRPSAARPAWEAPVAALVADGYALIEHALTLASGCEAWPAAPRDQYAAALLDAANALEARRVRLDPAPTEP